MNASSEYLQNVLTPGTPDLPADDGCPCHLAYLSALSDVQDSSGPMVFLNLDVPFTRTLEQPFVPFHPPLAL